MSRMALLVGINDYPGAQNDLQGCVNDITNMYDILVKYYSFLPSDIVLLSDSRARKKAILDALKNLFAGAKEGDGLVFHYSGHGSQVPDAEGDEVDGKDEVICPFDFDWETGLIKDDDLAALFASMKKGVRLEVILDSCHSGTGTREIIVDRHSLPSRGLIGMDAAALTGSAHCIRQRFIAPPPDVALRTDEIFGPPLRLRRIGRTEPMNHVLWSACRDNQYSADADIGGRPAGAFTYYFCRHIRDTQGTVARDQLLKLVRASLKHEGFSQVPQLECPAACAREGLFGSPPP
jgi:metacaspase-1